MSTSSAGAVGPFQFLPSTAKSLGVNPYDFKSAAFGAAKYLAQFKGRGTAGMLSAYNAGPGGALQPGYVQKVLQLAKGGPGSGTPAKLPALPGAVQQSQTRVSPQVQALGRLLTTKSAYDVGAPKVPGLGDPNSILKATGLLNSNVSATAPAPQQAQSQGVIQQAAGHYVNPFEGAQVQPSRIDQGVDYVVHGPIRAIGNATVKGIFHYQGFGTYLAYQLNDGPLAGHLIYVSEGMTPTVHEGQQLRAGQVIAYGNGAIEKGFAQNAPGYLPAAQATGGYTEGALTSAGDAFDRLMRSLGAPGGTRSGRPTVGAYRG